MEKEGAKSAPQAKNFVLFLFIICFKKFLKTKGGRPGLGKIKFQFFLGKWETKKMRRKNETGNFGPKRRKNGRTGIQKNGNFKNNF